MLKVVISIVIMNFDNDFVKYVRCVDWDVSVLGACEVWRRRLFFALWDVLISDVLMCGIL